MCFLFAGICVRSEELSAPRGATDTHPFADFAFHPAVLRFRFESYASTALPDEHHSGFDFAAVARVHCRGADPNADHARSEERRVGKEWRSRGSPSLYTI